MEKESFQPESHDLIRRAQLLIETETDPVVKGNMMVAAIEEGLPLSAEAVLQHLDLISDEDIRSPEVLTPFQKKLYIAQATIESFAKQGQFEETDSLIQFLYERDSYIYLKSLITLLGYGYAGPKGAYTQLTTADIRALAKRSIDNAQDGQSEWRERTTPKFYLELYLCAVARLGADVLELDSEYNRMLFEIADLGELPSDEAWQIQRRFKQVGSNYAQGKHIDRAIGYKNMLQDHTLRAKLCLEIAAHTDNPDIEEAHLQEIKELVEITKACKGECGHKFCKPARDAEELQLALLKHQAKRGPDDAIRALNTIGEPSFYFPHEQMLVYLEAYKQTGDATARKHSLSFLNEFTYYKQNIVAGYVREVAEADIRWKKTVPHPEAEHEVVPLVAWEVERVFWGIEKYLRNITGEDTSEPVEFDPDFNRGEPDESDQDLLEHLGMRLDEFEPDAVGPLSQSFGEDAVMIDLKDCQEQRDRAYVELATLLAKNGAVQSANYFLDKIVGSEETVRCMVAVAREINS